MSLKKLDKAHGYAYKCFRKLYQTTENQDHLAKAKIIAADLSTLIASIHKDLTTSPESTAQSPILGPTGDNGDSIPLG